ncbi:Fic family protein [Candidatus Peregrinibacteria bacterium]|nr:Fic family protein [Candidatus Peregrinibacteria bacterium]
MIQKIENLQIKINSHKPFLQEVLSLWQEKLRIDWTYNSNAIEGNTLTYGETAFFLREGLTSEGKPLKDYLEAKNHAEAIDYLLDVIKGEREITESFIKELHALLLKNIDFTYAKGANGQLIKKPLNAGKYKILPNNVLTISGKIHKYTDPIHVKDEMEKLIKWFNKEKSINEIEKACVFHYKFVAIHPFDDGNGRMARLLMNLILMKFGYPSCIIKNVNRKKYLESLELIDIEKNYQQFFVFIGEELVSTQKIMLDILEGKEDASSDYSKKINKSERENKIINIIGEEPISISQIMEKISQIKRPTLKNDLNRLCKAKKIKRIGSKKGAVYLKNPGKSRP